MSEVQLWIQAAEEKLPLLHCNVQGVTPGNKSQVSKLFQHGFVKLNNFHGYAAMLESASHKSAAGES